jgi:glucose/arabinose dehydrogenase/chitodextrinase
MFFSKTCFRSSSFIHGCLTLFLFAVFAIHPAAETFTDAGFASELVATLPTFGPVGVAWAPDGRMFIWMKNGVVRVLKNGSLLPTPFLDFSNKVNTFNDNGMIGFALDPDYANNGYIYLTYVYEPNGNPNDTSSKMGRLVRVTANPNNPDVMLSGSELIMFGNFPVDYGTHAIGTIRFASDWTMFFAFGDGGDPGSVDLNAFGAQDLNSVRGKFYRINRDGSAPLDNPFYDGTDSMRSRIWCYGIRNPYRFSLHPVTGEIYAADVGWNTWEEINHIVRGGNYGWPCFEGNGPQPLYQPQSTSCPSSSSVIAPIVTYNHTTGDLNGGGTCITGGDFYTGSLYPAQYKYNYFYADYSGEWIHRLVLDSAGNPVSTAVFARDVFSPTCIEQGPDGMLYYVSLSSGEIRRVKYNGPVAVTAANPLYGYSPLAVTFSSAGSTNAGGGSLTYAWDFGDGSTSTLANPSHTYTSPTVQTYSARLTVKNTAQQSSSATVQVTVGSLPPNPVISVPTGGTGYMPGQTVAYQGSATDPDEGPLAASRLTWTVLLHHNTHVHRFVGNTGSQGSFVVEDHGPVGTFSYEILLTATDSTGLSSTTSLSLPVLEDTVPPTAPSTLSGSPVGFNQVDLTWPSASDNAAIVKYWIERCQGAGCSAFTVVGTATSTAFSDTGLPPQTSFSYRVRAEDASGNFGEYSPVVVILTPNIPPPPPGLVAAYSFNEGNGNTVSDLSGIGNNGTVSAATWTTAGKYGSALSFSGTGRVTINDAPSLRLTGGMTLEAWVRPSVVSTEWRDVIYKGNDNYYLMATSTTGGRPCLGAMFGGTSAQAFGTTTLGLNTWTHIAGTYDGTMERFYVNGVQVATRAQSGNLTTSSNPLQIGGDSIYNQNFSGLIDEVRVYNRALTVAEIQTDMNTPIGGAPPPDTTAPTVPSGLSALAVSGSQINLNWTGSADNVGVTGYLLERSQGAGSTAFTQIGTSISGTSFNDTGLTANTIYNYRARATDAAGNLSGYSIIATATTPAPDTTAPGIPSGLSATAIGNTQVNLSWTASTDNVGVTGYLVERSQGVGSTSFAQVATPAGTSSTDTGLLPGTVYNYRVRATDAAANLSGYSIVATATTSNNSTPAGLVAAYAFNEGTGTAVSDISGNGNNGTVNAATWSTAGKYGSALSFNGSSARVTINDAPSLRLTTSMTLEAWVRPSSVSSAWRDVIYKGNDNYYLMATTTTGSRPCLGAIFGASTYGEVFGTASLAVNSWSHIAGTYDGTIERLYLNGVQVASTAQTGNIITSANPLTIGSDPIYGQYFSGLIDDVRVYNRALTAAEIQSDMNTPLGGTPPPDTTAPSTPSGLGANATSSSQINLTWTASTDNVGVTGYLLERSQGAGSTAFAPVGPTMPGVSFNDTGLAASTVYNYRLRATDAAGNLSGYSSVATATTPAPPDTTLPSTPAGLAANATSSSQINLTWTASTDNVGVTGYLLERSQGAGSTAFAQVGTTIPGTSFNNTGLAANTVYNYRVRATDAAGNFSGYSSVATGTTPAAADTTPPSTPSGLITNPTSSSQIALTWTASTDNVGVIGYLLERSQGAGSTVFAQIGTAISGTSFNDAGLTGNTVYNYRIRATDAAGNLSGYSSVATGTTPAAADTTPPSTPSGLIANPMSSSQIALTWTASTDNVEVIGYLLERSQGAGSTLFAQVGTVISGTSFNDTSLTGNTVYNYRVRATDAAGNLSGYSTVATATTLVPADTTAPTVPSGVGSTTAGSSQINLAWTASADNVGVTGYLVERSQGAGSTTFTQIATPIGPSYNDTGLSAATVYNYRVRATDAAGNLSGYSTTATATTSTGSIPAGLVAAYSFNQGAGTTVSDLSGNGNTGTISGATWSTSGKYGPALSFNGTSARVTINDAPSLRLTSGMTLEAWVRPSSVTSAWRDILYKGNDNYYLMATTDRSNRPCLGGIFGTSTYGEVFGTAALTANTWAHIAGTYDGITERLYINGVQVASRAQTGNLLTSANPLTIGSDPIYGQYFSGLIDDVRVYNRALTVTEIQTDMNTALTP